MASGSDRFQIQVFRNPTEESLSGYPKYANNEARAHMIAEEAVRELQSAGDAGEYLVTVSLEDKTPLGSQVVIVPSKDSGDSPSEETLGLEGA